MKMRKPKKTGMSSNTGSSGSFPLTVDWNGLKEAMDTDLWDDIERKVLKQEVETLEKAHEQSKQKIG